MYQSSYAEILADSPTNARSDERLALDQAIALLQQAEPTPQGSEAERQAISFLMQLWALFVKSSRSPENDLPKPLRANLISVGLGVMAEANRVQAGQSRNLAGLAEVCGIIRDGLN